MVVNKKRCPECGREYTELENYCTRCGTELEKIPNKCSEMKTDMCVHRIYDKDDVYCSYCGALTTYAKEANSRKIK